MKNVNVGVLGHVDCGKTSLVACLSTCLSTAALDKHPQSQQRGITLDLGFSSLVVHDESSSTPDQTQITLVDCPGHAQLIKTVVGGSHIIDMMMLVVDITRGIQPQTAECLIIGEITTEHLIVVLNKVDLVPADKCAAYVRKATKMIRKTLEGTRFAGARVVPATTKDGDRGVTELVAALAGMAGVVSSMTEAKRKRDDETPFMMHIDHCFAIKGQGTVITGTISAGTLGVGQTVSLPHMGIERKVKSIQAFKRPVVSARSGDRVGVCLANVNASSIERGIACEPGSMLQFTKAVARVGKVRFYPDRLPSKRKLHIMIGHSSVMGTVEFFGVPRYSTTKDWITSADAECPFSFENEYLYQDELYGHEGRPEVGDDGRDSAKPFHGPQWALITFAERIISRPGELLLGAKLDAHLDSCSCRIAMKGVLEAVKLEDTLEEGNRESRHGGVKLFKFKSKRGVVDKVETSGCEPGPPGDGSSGGVTAICGGLFGPNSVMTKFLGMHCVCVQEDSRTNAPEVVHGRIVSKFGSKGQCRIVFAKDVRVGDNVLVSYRKFLANGDIKQ
jgi:selenocysteine-specific elongation factor